MKEVQEKREREMESATERVTVGKSILVPSVKELAKGCLDRVPDRYIRPDQDPSFLPSEAFDDHKNNDGHSIDLRIPILSMEELISADQSELQRLHLACKEWGFFQLINHGISSSLVEKFKLETQEFFKLPLEEKKKYWQTPEDIEGYGQAFVVSEEQKLDWGDMFYLTTLPKHQRRPNLLPNLPLHFRQTMENYLTEMQNLAMKIFECMAKALNIDVEIMRGLFGEGYQSIRMNYYPPCPQSDKVIGLSPHTDGPALLTILLQVNEVEGLQIRKDGRWVSIQPLPGAFILNIGDILEIVSNGIYPSTMHRAVVNTSKERLSVATFHSPANDRDVGPIPDLITKENPKRFRDFIMADYWKGFLAASLDGKSYINFVRINENKDVNTN